MSTNSRQIAIDDDGEFIPGAVKHGYGRGNKAVPPASDKAQRITLRELWPEPDWVEAAHKKDNTVTTLTFYAVYHNIRKSPRESSSPREQEALKQHYINGIALLKKLFGFAHSKRHTVVDKQKLKEVWLTQLGFPATALEDKKFTIDDLLPALAVGLGKGRTWRLPTSFKFYHNELIKHGEALGFPRNPNVLSYAFFPLKFDKGSVYICEVKNNRWRRAHDESYSTIEEAIPKAIEINERESAKAKEKKEPQKEIDEPGFFFSKARKNLFIEKADRLKRDLTTADHLRYFGMRGIQFGNSMPVSERQKWLNNVGLAYMDLAAVIGLEKSEFSLLSVGKLAVAFGARGRSAAAAHYESELNVINLTRKNGPGSIAHEWIHALDCKVYAAIYRNQQQSNKSAFLTHCHLHPSDIKDANIRALYSEILTIMEALQSSNFYRQARRIGGQHGAKKSYWTAPHELFARAFESYVEDKLAHQNRRNDWLVCETIDPYLPVGHEDKNPYPEGRERHEFFELFESLMPLLKPALKAL